MILALLELKKKQERNKKNCKIFLPFINLE